MLAGSQVLAALCCRRVWRLGYRRGVGWVRVALGVPTASSVVAGLLGPVVNALYAVVLNLLVWLAWWWLTAGGRLAWRHVGVVRRR